MPTPRIRVVRHSERHRKNTGQVHLKGDAKGPTDIMHTSLSRAGTTVLVLGLLAVGSSRPSLAADHPPKESRAQIAAKARHPGAHGAPVDYSGRKRRGKASYYAHSFSGKKMADGSRLNPQADVAASKTLPLGTTAVVKNLANGKTAKVEIKDRGPYVDGRIVDVTPKVAQKLDIRKEGVAPVEVVPIEVPQPDGTVKPGAALTGPRQDRDVEASR